MAEIKGISILYCAKCSALFESNSPDEYQGSLGIAVIDQYIWRCGVSRIGNPTYIWRCVTENPREPYQSCPRCGSKSIRTATVDHPINYVTANLACAHVNTAAWKINPQGVTIQP
jgi:DNA-directed RNA polymerase subunit RPC12/RpoP